MAVVKLKPPPKRKPYVLRLNGTERVLTAAEELDRRIAMLRQWVEQLAVRADLKQRIANGAKRQVDREMARLAELEARAAMSTGVVPFGRR